MPRIPLRRRLLASALVPLLGLGLGMGSAQAEIGFPDTVPAATLLLPYFAVDLANPNGAQTRFSVINTAAAPTLAKVTLWSNLGVPTFSFDIYLEGRDTLQVDLRQVFAGMLPQTGPGRVTVGSESNASVSFTGCTAGANQALGVSLPVPTRLSDAQIAHLAAAHTGRQSASLSNQCAGANLGDRVARGYATVDVVNQCAVSNPSIGGYFVDGGTGIAGNANVLAGSFTLTERPADIVSGSSPLVHIEASDTDPLTSDAGDYTFYSSYNGADGSDNREPLGGVWQVPLQGNPVVDAGTDVLVWRDTGGRAPTPFASSTCTAPSSLFPLEQTAIVLFDETEQYLVYNQPPPPPNPPAPPLTPFGFATQLVEASTLTPFAAGWAIFNLNTFGGSNTPGGIGMGQPQLRQSVVLTRTSKGPLSAPLRLAVQSANISQQTTGPLSCSSSNFVNSCNSFSSGVGSF
jgi:hypothetical protein